MEIQDRIDELVEERRRLWSRGTPAPQVIRALTEELEVLYAERRARRAMNGWMPGQLSSADEDTAYMKLAQLFLAWQPSIASSRAPLGQTFHAQWADWVEANLKFIRLTNGHMNPSRLVALLRKGRPYGKRPGPKGHPLPRAKPAQKPFIRPELEEAREDAFLSRVFLERLERYLGEPDVGLIRAAFQNGGRPSRGTVEIRKRVCDFLKTTTFSPKTVAVALDCSERSIQRLIQEK